MKIIIRTILLLAMSASLSNKINAQQKADSVKKYLNAGDMLPDLPLGQLINYSGREKSLHDFKGKLLILDFWATWCAPCVGAFPGNDQLRQEFGERIAILPITYEDAPKAQAMLSNIEKDKKTTKLFSVINDKAIRALFNFNTIPHYVWVDKTGKIIAQSSDDQLTKENIETVLSGERAAIVEKNKVVKRRDMNQRLFKIDNFLIDEKKYYKEPVPDSNIFMRSTLTKAIDGLGMFHNNMPHEYTSVNQTVQWFYKVMLGRLNSTRRHEAQMFTTDNRVIWEARDSIFNLLSHERTRLLSRGDYDKWMMNHTYCYEIVVPNYVSAKEMYIKALAEVGAFFRNKYGIEGVVERRRVKCRILERTSNINKLNSKNTEMKPNGAENKFGFNIANKPFDFFLMQFATYYFQMEPLPFVDETGFDPLMRVDMNIQCKLSDPVAVGKELEKYDLHFKEDYREIDMIVIRDAKGY